MRSDSSTSPRVMSASARNNGDVPADEDGLSGDAASKKSARGLAHTIASRGGPFPGVPWSGRVLEAIARVPRHAFVPRESRAIAYEDEPLPIGFGQTISQPTVVAMIAQATELTGRERVLEVGTGCGYQAAVLAELASHVYSIEVREELARSARERLAGLGVDRVSVRVGDGYAGWAEEAPFDRIVLTAAPPSLPMKLVDQLDEGGVLVAPIGPEDGLQELTRVRKKSGHLTYEPLGAVRFVPMVPRSRI